MASAVVVPTLAAATPSPPASPGTSLGAPNVGAQIADVQERLQYLVRRNAELVERYNQATITYGNRVQAARGADARYAVARRELRVAHDNFSAAVAARYEGGSFSATGALLDSNSNTNYLDQLQTLSMLAQHNSQLVSNFTATQRQAELAKRQADVALANAKSAKRNVQRARVETKNEIAKYRALLASLNAKQRAIWAAQATSQSAITSRSQAVRLPDALQIQMSPRVRTAVMFALNQVGKPYVWGSAGPSTFDCSGLTMAAYAAAGVTLPHSAYHQYDYGHHVAFNQMKPGDLMFFYSPIAHVTMYIGDGMMVSAPETGDVVKVISADSFRSDFSGATRLIG